VESSAVESSSVELSELELLTGSTHPPPTQRWSELQSLSRVHSGKQSPMDALLPHCVSLASLAPSAQVASERSLQSLGALHSVVQTPQRQSIPAQSSSRSHETNQIVSPPRSSDIAEHPKTPTSVAPATNNPTPRAHNQKHVKAASSDLPLSEPPSS